MYKLYQNALTFWYRLVLYDTFYGGQIQQDSSECLMMLIELINKVSVPYCVSNNTNDNNNNSTSFYVLYITPTYTSSMQELIMQRMQQNYISHAFDIKRTLGMANLTIFLQPRKYLIIIVNQLRYINNNFTKDGCSIPMDMTVVLGLRKFSLQTTIDHHGPSIRPSMYSGHHTSINCCNQLQQQQNYGVRNIRYQKLLYC